MMNGKIDEEIMDVMEANEDDIELFEDEKEGIYNVLKPPKRKSVQQNRSSL